MTDDRPPCTLGPPTAPSTCYCTNRPGCPFDGGDDVCRCGDVLCPGDCDEPEDDAGLGDGWLPIETIDTGGLL